MRISSDWSESTAILEHIQVVGIGSVKYDGVRCAQLGLLARRQEVSIRKRQFHFANDIAGKNIFDSQDLTPRSVFLSNWGRIMGVCLRPVLSGLGHKYDDVRGKGFFAQTRRERRAYPEVDL